MLDDKFRDNIKFRIVDQTVWVRAMNNIRNAAEEIDLSDIFYS